MARRLYRPHTLEWPPTPEQWHSLNETLDDLYRLLRPIDADARRLPTTGDEGDYLQIVDGAIAFDPHHLSGATPGTYGAGGDAVGGGGGGGGGASFIPALTPPVDSDYTWVNQGTATVATTSLGGIFVVDATAGSLNLRVRKKAAPSAPYVITAAWLPRLISTAFSGVGIGWRDATTGKLVILGFRFNTGSTMQLVVDKYNSPTSYSATYASQNVPSWGPMLFLRIEDNNTNRICSWSTDGENFLQVHSVTRLDFLTPDEVFFGLYINTNATAGTLMSWAEA